MYGRANMVVMRGFRMDPSITKQKLKPGTHKVQLRCDSETDVVERPTITAFAISSG